MLTLLTLLACEPPVEAPEELGDLLLFTFANFTAEEDDYLLATVDGYQDYLLGVDMEAPAADRAVTPPILYDEDLGGATAPEGADPDAQLNVAVSASSTATLEQTLSLIVDPNQVCITADTTKYYRRTFDTDPDCFEDQTCSTLEVSNEARTESILADVWLDTQGEFRLVTTEDDQTVLFGRSWMPDKAIADDGVDSWDQRYTLDLWLPHPTQTGETLRMTTMWAAVSIATSTDDLYVAAVISGLDEAFENAAAFLAGEECKNDRDAEYTRE